MAAPAHGGTGRGTPSLFNDSNLSTNGRAGNPLPVYIAGKVAPHLKYKLFSASEGQTELNGFEAMPWDGCMKQILAHFWGHV